MQACESVVVSGYHSKNYIQVNGSMSHCIDFTASSTHALLKVFSLILFYYYFFSTTGITRSITRRLHKYNHKNQRSRKYFWFIALRVFFFRETHVCLQIVTCVFMARRTSRGSCRLNLWPALRGKVCVQCMSSVFVERVLWLFLVLCFFLCSLLYFTSSPTLYWHCATIVSLSH